MTICSNNYAIKKRTLTLAIATSLMIGCGGGTGTGTGSLGGIDGGDTMAPIGSSGNIFVSGAINGFGSIIVNGVTYQTSGAEIRVDGQPATENELKVGKIVRMSASMQGTQYVANKVVYDADLEGAVESIDLATNTLVVLGRTVNVSGITSFDDDIPGRTLEGLIVGNYVDVSGFTNANNEINATRIQLDDDEEYEITGFVSNLDSGTKTFNINSLVIDYSTALLEDFDGAEIADGNLVEVEGERLGVGGELIAVSVELERGFRRDFDDDDFDDEIEIEGLITRFASATDFDVAGIPVTTNSNTEFNDGSTDDLALDVLVEVEGRFNTEGILVADEIEFEDEGELEIEAQVDAVDVAAGRVTMLGITVEITDKTRMEDSNNRFFSFEDIRVGDWLEVKGSEKVAGSNLLTATKVEREDGGDEAEVKGFATDVLDPSLRILGLEILITSSTEFEDISRDDFFATAEGGLVEVKGSYNGANFVATEVDLDDDDDD